MSSNSHVTVTGMGNVGTCESCQIAVHVRPCRLVLLGQVFLDDRWCGVAGLRLV